MIPGFNLGLRDRSKVRFGEGAETSTRGTCAPRTKTNQDFKMRLGEDTLAVLLELFIHVLFDHVHGDLANAPAALRSCGQGSGDVTRFPDRDDAACRQTVAPGDLEP